MDLHQAVNERRSVRKYQDTHIPPEVLQRVMDAARRAPSWANTQTTRWIVVTNPELKADLATTLSPGNPSTQAVIQAPVVLALCYVKGRSGYYKGEARTVLGDWGFFDAGLAAANLTLAAAAEGLGTVHVGAMSQELAAQILELPPEVQLVELIPLGYPAVKPDATSRLEAAKVISQEKYRSAE
jgi:nitroreductase